MAEGKPDEHRESNLSVKLMAHLRDPVRRHYCDQMQSGASMPSNGFIQSQNRFDFPVDRDVVWEHLMDVDSYRSWWPWLRTFDAPQLAQGVRWQCEVQPPLPYRIKFGVVFDQVIDESEIRASIDGEVVGSASLSLSACEGGCAVLLQSNLAPVKPSLKLVSLIAPPVARFGHEWVLETGVRQFKDKALGGTS